MPAPTLKPNPGSQMAALVRREAERVMTDAANLQARHYRRDFAALNELCRRHDIDDDRMVIGALTMALKDEVEALRYRRTFGCYQRLAALRAALAAELATDQAMAA